MPRWALLLGGLVIVGVVLGNLSRCAEDKITSERAKNQRATETAEAKAPAPAVEAPMPAYKVAKVEDVSVGATPRYLYRVVVTGKPTPTDLRAIATKVFETAKAGRAFSALRVGFFDYPEYADREFTLGTVEYAPNGDWASASSIEPGDYASLKATADLATKDWSKQLTPAEVKVWAAWWAEYRKQADAIGSDPGKTVDEDTLTAQIAKSAGKTPAEVKAILLKQQVWTSE